MYRTQGLFLHVTIAKLIKRQKITRKKQKSKSMNYNNGKTNIKNRIETEKKGKKERKKKRKKERKKEKEKVVPAYNLQVTQTWWQNIGN